MSALFPLRYAAFYGAVFLALGIYLPFWPVWLAHRGIGPEAIGLLFALASWTRVAATPAIALLADRSGRGKATLAAVAGLSLVAFAGFLAAQGFWPILVVTVISAIFFNALVPLGESQTMAAVLREGLDYGRIRLWGSLAFILGTAGAGRLLTGRDPDLVLVLILVALALTFAAALAMPAPRAETAAAESRGLAALLLNRRFLAFLAAASLLQASHVVYYAFSALHWTAAGLSEATVGWLWAEGVIAEVLLFAVSGAAVARLGPGGLLLAAGLGGLVRWTTLGLTAALPALVAAQALHAATFGAAHLGAMHLIARSAPPGLSATAQSLYSAVSGGIVMGLAMLLAGRLYQGFGGHAFLAMAGLSGAGALLAFRLWRRSDPAA